MDNWEKVGMLQAWFLDMRTASGGISPIDLTSDKRFILESKPDEGMLGRLNAWVSYGEFSEVVHDEDDVREILEKELRR